jgi:hypothetical protein
MNMVVFSRNKWETEGQFYRKFTHLNQVFPWQVPMQEFPIVISKHGKFVGAHVLRLSVSILFPEMGIGRKYMKILYTL